MRRWLIRLDMMAAKLAARVGNVARGMADKPGRHRSLGWSTSEMVAYGRYAP